MVRGTLNYGINTRPRTKTYDKPHGRAASHDTYKPIPNEGLVRSLGAHTIGEEYLRIISPISSDAAEDENPRRLYVATDTVVEINNIAADLRGDALFVFNALAISRGTLQKTKELWEYGSGFRSHCDRHTNLSTHFMRAVQALDAWSREASEHDFVYRTDYGTGKMPGLMLYPDLEIIDTRLTSNAKH